MVSPKRATIVSSPSVLSHRWAYESSPAIQKYADLWAGLTSKSKKTIPATAVKTKKVSPPATPALDAATQIQIDELKKYIKEEEGESGDSGFGDPKARIAHWRKEIEELKKPKEKK